MSRSSSAESSALRRTSTKSSLLDVPGIDKIPIRPQNTTHMSTPSYESPLRHHRRQPSTPRQVKETLHARSEYTNSEDDGGAVHRINQYIIKQEVGRGSFGAVHLAVDQYGNEYAVKEFSKSRLRKRAQSSILRRPGARSPAGHLAAGGINNPLHRRSASDIHKDEEAGNPLYLIREEIAIMKKLNHPNLVSLLEVLDDPAEDSLYMVLEMCKKGVVMKVGMHEPAEPYEPERCRTWFRDLILGIEYLHAQGVVHRDIKPDNLLLTEDDVLKIVDFGVSEMFEKDSDFLTTKSAGSPAFLPPELCVSNHGKVSGRAADIWSMGITLYCLYFGRVPFEKINPLELYESIREEKANLQNLEEEDMRDLLGRILEKDPDKRIDMQGLREHPWVTKRGTDPLLPYHENTADLVEPPTKEEIKSAITGNLSNLLIVMKAVRKFKQLISRRRPEILDSILGQHIQMVLPPEPMHLTASSSRPLGSRSHSNNIDVRIPIEQALVREGVHRRIDVDKVEKPLTIRDDAAVLGRNVAKPVVPKEHYAQALSGDGAEPAGLGLYTTKHAASRESSEDFHGKGQAHDPLFEEFRFLAVGSSSGQYLRTPQDSPPIISESPSAAEGNIYETAYHEEVERIRQNSTDTTLYVTKRVQNTDRYKGDKNMLGIGQDMVMKSMNRLMSKAKEARAERSKKDSNDGTDIGALLQEGTSAEGLKKLTKAAVEDLKQVHQEKLAAADDSTRGENMKRLAEATIDDLKEQAGKLSRTNSKEILNACNSNSSFKDTIKDLKNEYHVRHADDKGASAVKNVWHDLKDTSKKSDQEGGGIRAVIDTLKHKRKGSKDSNNGEEVAGPPGLVAIASAAGKEK